jgi:hypothetical protein
MTVSVLRRGGPLPVDADGNVYAGTYIDIETAEALVGVSITDFELRDISGSVVARGIPSAQLTELGTNNRVIGAFSGDISAGIRIRLWVSMRLDASLSVLNERPPARFRLVLTQHDGTSFITTGEVDANSGILA